MCTEFISAISPQTRFVDSSPASTPIAVGTPRVSTKKHHGPVSSIYPQRYPMPSWVISTTYHKPLPQLPVRERWSGAHSEYQQSAGEQQSRQFGLSRPAVFNTKMTLGYFHAPTFSKSHHFQSRHGFYQQEILPNGHLVLLRSTAGPSVAKPACKRKRC